MRRPTATPLPQYANERRPLPRVGSRHPLRKYGIWLGLAAVVLLVLAYLPLSRRLPATRTRRHVLARMQSAHKRAQDHWGEAVKASLSAESASTLSPSRPSSLSDARSPVVPWDGKSMPVGVPAARRAVFASAMDKGVFECHGVRRAGMARGNTTQLPLARVNDDYCDCDDGSDEPGTPACAGRGGQFACAPVEGLPETVLAASRVSDGVCDCCDGSDEPVGHCANTCSSAREHLAERRAKQQRGRARRDDMVRDAKALRAGASAHAYASLDAGEDDAFLPLATRCFYSEAFGEFIYTVCPFHNVTQVSIEKVKAGAGGHAIMGIVRARARANARSAQATVLGKRFEWRARGLVMLLADGQPCGARGKRRTEISFVCGDHDAVGAVSEPEMCSYHINFLTPAAC